MSHRSRKAITSILCCLALFSACSTDEQSYVPVISLLFSGSPAEEAIQAAWRPSALFIDDDGLVFFADQAVRKIRRLDPNTGNVQTIANLAQEEPRFGAYTASDDTWGLELRGNQDFLLLAGKGRNLCFLSKDNFQTTFLGKAGQGQKPKHGVRLADLDCSSLQGIGLDENALFLALDHQVFKVSLPQTNTLENLPNQTLEHIAGDPNGELKAFGESKNMRLNLPEWASLLPLSTGELFIPETKQLQLYKDGKILRLTGKGSLVGSNIALEDFYAKYLPDTVIARSIQNTIQLTYGYKRDQILELQLETLDWENGKVKGRVYTRAIGFNHYMSSFDAYKNGILYTSLSAGSLIAWQDQELTPLLGPLDPDARTQFDNEEYAQKYITDYPIGPQAIASLQNDQIFLLNEPLLSRLSIHFSTPPDFLTTPIWNLDDLSYFKHIVSNTAYHPRLFYATQGRELYRIHLNDDLTFETSVIKSFFKAPEYLGLPAKQEDVRFEEPPKLYRDRSGLLLYFQDIPMFARWNSNLGELTIENSPAMGSDIPKPGDYPYTLLGELNLNRVENIQTSERFRVVVAKNHAQEEVLLFGNATSKDVELWGNTFRTNKYKWLAGSGASEPYDGQPASETRWNEITALDLNPNNVLTLAHQSSKGKTTLWTLDANGDWRQQARSCGELPAGKVQALRALVGQNTELYALQIEQDIYACQTKGETLFIGQRALTNTWERVLQGVQLFDAYQVQGDNNIAWASLQDNELCAAILHNQPEPMRCDTSPLYQSAKDVSFYPHKEKLKLAISTWNPENKPVIYDIPYQTSFSPSYLMGAGIGLPRQTTLNNFLPGLQITDLQLDADGNLYLAATDTHAIWKVSNSPEGEITKDSKVQLLIRDEALLCDTCHTQIHVSRAGTLFAANLTDLYTVQNFKKVKLMGSGPLPVHEALVAEEAFSHRIIDIASIQENPCLLTVESLFCILPDASLLHFTDHGNITLDATTYHLTTPTLTSNTLISSSTQDALFLPHFATHSLFKISYFSEF